MSPVDELVALLKKLRLSGILATLEMRTRQAAEDDLSHVEFLVRLLTDEIERRDGKLLDKRIRKATFEQHRTIEDFDFLFNPQIPKARVLDLATCAFVPRHESVILSGATGVGKSHIAQAIGHRACRAGYSVQFIAATDMLKQLRAARADNTYYRRLLRFTSPALLIVDDVGLRPMTGDEPHDLYEVIRQRYERGATMITTNRHVEELPAIFLDPLLASAALDRLMHHAHVLDLEGDTYRNPPPHRAQSNKRPPTQESR